METLGSKSAQNYIRYSSNTDVWLIQHVNSHPSVHDIDLAYITVVTQCHMAYIPSIEHDIQNSTAL